MPCRDRLVVGVTSPLHSLPKVKRARIRTRMVDPMNKLQLSLFKTRCALLVAFLLLVGVAMGLHTLLFR